MNTFDMLHSGYPLAWDKRSGLIVTWNSISTYYVWADHDGTLENIFVRAVEPTSGGYPVSLDAATVIAGEVLTSVIRGE